MSYVSSSLLRKVAPVDEELLVSVLVSVHFSGSQASAGGLCAGVIMCVCV